MEKSARQVLSSRVTTRYDVYQREIIRGNRPQRRANVFLADFKEVTIAGI